MHSFQISLLFVNLFRVSTYWNLCPVGNFEKSACALRRNLEVNLLTHILDKARFSPTHSWPAKLEHSCI